jgi:hypothetical protein
VIERLLDGNHWPVKGATIPIDVFGIGRPIWREDHQQVDTDFSYFGNNKHSGYWETAATASTGTISIPITEDMQITDHVAGGAQQTDDHEETGEEDGVSNDLSRSSDVAERRENGTPLRWIRTLPIQMRNPILFRNLRGDSLLFDGGFSPTCLFEADEHAEAMMAQLAADPEVIACRTELRGLRTGYADIPNVLHDPDNYAQLTGIFDALEARYAINVELEQEVRRICTIEIQVMVDWLNRLSFPAYQYRPSTDIPMTISFQEPEAYQSQVEEDMHPSILKSGRAYYTEGSMMCFMPSEDRGDGIIPRYIYMGVKESSVQVRQEIVTDSLTLGVQWQQIPVIVMFQPETGMADDSDDSDDFSDDELIEEDFIKMK